MSIWKTLYIYTLHIKPFLCIIGIVKKGKNSIKVCVNLAKDNNSMPRNEQKFPNCLEMNKKSRSFLKTSMI
jgi:hypothetical protein